MSYDISNDSTSFEQLAGGAIRVTSGNSAPSSTPMASAGPTSTVHQGAISLSEGQIKQGGTTRHEVSFDGTAGGSVAATLSHQGGHWTVETAPGDPTSRTRADLAARWGLLELADGGKWRDVAPRQPQQGSDEDPGEGGSGSPAVDAPSYIDADDEALWAEDIDPLPQHAYNAAGPSVIGAVLRGDTLDDSAKALAHNAGISPAMAAQYVEEGFAKGRRLVDRALAPLGLSGERLEQFYEAAKERPQDLQQAMQRVWHGNDAGGFQEMAVAWKVQNPGDLSHFTRAGLETFVDRQTGDVHVRQPGRGWVRAADLGRG